MRRALQFNGDGELLLDDQGNPLYGPEPTGDIVQATRTVLNTFHGDRDMGGRVPLLTSGEPSTDADAVDAVGSALQRLEDLGTLVVEAIDVEEGGRILVYSQTTAQPFVVNL